VGRSALSFRTMYGRDGEDLYLHGQQTKFACYGNLKTRGVPGPASQVTLSGWMGLLSRLCSSIQSMTIALVVAFGTAEAKVMIRSQKKSMVPCPRYLRNNIIAGRWGGKSGTEADKETESDNGVLGQLHDRGIFIKKAKWGPLVGR